MGGGSSTSPTSLAIRALLTGECENQPWLIGYGCDSGRDQNDSLVASGTVSGQNCSFAPEFPTLGVKHSSPCVRECRPVQWAWTSWPSLTCLSQARWIILSCWNARHTIIIWNWLDSHRSRQAKIHLLGETRVVESLNSWNSLLWIDLVDQIDIEAWQSWCTGLEEWMRQDICTCFASC